MLPDHAGPGEPARRGKKPSRMSAGLGWAVTSSGRTVTTRCAAANNWQAAGLTGTAALACLESAKHRSRLGSPAGLEDLLYSGATCGPVPIAALSLAISTARRVKLNDDPLALTLADRALKAVQVGTLFEVAAYTTARRNLGRQAAIWAHIGTAQRTPWPTAGPFSVPPAGTRAAHARSVPPALIASVNACQSSGVNVSTGPPGSLESRKATTPGRLWAI